MQSGRKPAEQQHKRRHTAHCTHTHTCNTQNATPHLLDRRVVVRVRVVGARAAVEVGAGHLFGELVVGPFFGVFVGHGTQASKQVGCLFGSSGHARTRRKHTPPQRNAARGSTSTRRAARQVESKVFFNAGTRSAASSTPKAPPPQ
jgi:hypothetical protein